MATYDDFHGVYFSIQAIRMFHPEVLDDIEFIVVDNNPSGGHGKEVRKFLDHVPNSRYIPFDQFASTAIRNIIFMEAKSPYVVSMDCHVIFESGSLRKLIDYYESNPDTENLLQGPLVYDDLNNYSTHFEPVWREEMYGIWSTDKRGANPDNEPFEIPMQGLGVFSCRKKAWLGFNPLFRGFGGEEGYIHEKFRLNGRKTLCLPFLRWVHRFGRPDGVAYPLTVENKVRNYFVAAVEIYQITKDNSFIRSIVEEFSKRVPDNVLETLFNDAARGQGVNDLFLFKPDNPSYLLNNRPSKSTPKDKVEIVRKELKKVK
tara:strand:+ start:20025 stop:20972 length:948 start_codon:yes stop_codon:yes gene_type:complete